ncbi:MAG: NADH-quinone oxidoreductase subunit M [Chitinophagales bacterium]|nr:NADH-quinone oxidoreductase subunit M [Chitinophagales bacterium]MDW8393645.1 NADH-quinone oxidoreductase subunit M [Chitinophagales bacterium]
MLSAIVLLPLLALIPVLLLPERYSRSVVWSASFAALLLVLYGARDVWEGNGKAWLVDWTWMDALGVRLLLNCDGLTYILLLLTALLYPLLLLAEPAGRPVSRPRSYYALLLLMQAALFGVFLARDALLFYVFYELALIPIFFLTAFWGGEGSRRITLKFFVYTLAGSLFLLVAILYLYWRTPEPHSFSFEAFYGLDLTLQEQIWLFAALFFAFAVKIPVFPFHTWQPDTYTVAPLAGSMLLAGIMLKMGIYGLMRLVLPVVPDAVASWGWVAISLCVAGMLYGSFIALRQQDLKRLVAYSSLAHVGLIAAGVLSASSSGMQGAAFQMFSHGIIVYALFLAVDILERRYGTRRMDELGGVAGQMRRFGWLFAVVLLGSVGLPLTNGFIGEFLLLNGLFLFRAGLAALAGMTIVLSVAYMLRWYRLVFFGDVRQEGRGDLSAAEGLALLVCAAVIVGTGIYPMPLLQLTEPVAERLLSFVSESTAALLP